tara:strand:- start:72 stop:1838 length:1767 start_codon:yes stop_codon:yes gene_type:complete
MKIQAYRPRAQFTDDVVAQPLNVQANSSAFEAVGQAVASGQADADKAAALMVHQQKLTNAKEVAGGESAFATRLEQIRENIEADPKFNSDPKKMEMEFNSRANIALKNIRKKVAGSLAKTTFSSQAATTARGAMLKAKQNARVRLTAEAITAKLVKSDQLQREIGKLDPVRDKHDYKTKIDELFGNPKTGQVGIFGELVLLGHLDAKQQFTYEQNARNKIAVHQVEKGLLAANQMSLGKEDMKNGAAAKQVREVLMRLQKGHYPDLTVQARQDLAERANNLIFSLERSRIAEHDRKLRNEGKEQIKKRNNNFIAYLTSISEAQRNPGDLTKQAAKPTLAELDIALATDKIDDVQYGKIIDSLNSQFAQVTDKVYHSNLLRRIRNAPDKATIDAIVQEAYKNQSPTAKNPLDGAQVREVVQYAEQFTSKTKRAIETKKFGDLLEALVKPSGILDKLLGGADERGALVLFQFDAQVKEGGVSPQQAFRDAIQQFEITDKANLNAIPYPLHPPQFMDEVRKVSFKKDLKNWTVDDVEQSRAMTMTKFKGKPSLLGSELFKLRMLQKYIEARTPALDAAVSQSKQQLRQKNP